MGALVTTRPGIAPSTQYQYERALARLDAALDGRALDDAALADYLLGLFKSGKSPGTVQQVVSAVRFRAKVDGDADPVGPDCRWVLAENRYENLSPLAETRLVAGIRPHARLLGDPDLDEPESDVLKEFKQRNRALQRLKFRRGRIPEGRRFMGGLYRRELDFPKTLLKGLDFRTCRACGTPDLRMSGIYWCFGCAFMIKAARRKLRGSLGLLTSIFGGKHLEGDFEWKNLKTVVKEIRSRRGVRGAR